MQERWDPDGLGLRPVCNASVSDAAKSRYLTMVSASAAAAIFLPSAFVFVPPVQQTAGWVAAELYWPAVVCALLSAVGSALLLVAAARNSPSLLLTAGATAATTLATGLTALFPEFPATIASRLLAACRFIFQMLVQLSLGAPLLYAALVGVSAAASVMTTRRLDGATLAARRTCRRSSAFAGNSRWSTSAVSAKRAPATEGNERDRRQ